MTLDCNPSGNHKPSALESPRHLDPLSDPKTVSSDRHLLTGCYELLHFGHLNALRQVKQSGPNVHVVAGIHSNEEILKVKGGVCILTESEKERTLMACKFVDEVAHDIKYGTVRPEEVDCRY